MAGGKESAPLDCYVRVEPPRAEQAAILENEVRPAVADNQLKNTPAACLRGASVLRAAVPTPPAHCTGADNVRMRAGSHHNARQNPKLHLLCDCAAHGEAHLKTRRAGPCSPAKAALDLLCLTCAATLCAQDKKHSSVSLKAMGQAINKTVTIGTRPFANVI